MAPVIGAARLNVLFGILSVLVALVSSIALARFLPTEVLVDYATIMSLVTWASLIFDLGVNYGFAWKLKQAGEWSARNRLYRIFQLHRWCISPIMAILAVSLGPLWAQASGLSADVWTSQTFLLMAAVVAATLHLQLSYYALIASFHHREALGWTQGMSIIRSIGLVIVALIIPEPIALASLLFVIAIGNALIFWLKSRNLFKGETAPLPPGAIWSTYRHGFAVLLDKISSSIGSGPFLLIFLAAHFSRPELAMLVIANDFLQKALSTANIPMGNMVVPYVNANHQSPDFASMLRKVGTLGLLIIGPAMAAVAVFALNGLAFVYGDRYQAAWVAALIMVLPMFVDAWTRMIVNFGVIASGAYGPIAAFNMLRICLSLVLLWLTMPFGLEAVLFGQGALQLLSSAIVLRLAVGSNVLGPSVMPGGLLTTLTISLLAGVAVQIPLPASSPLAILSGMSAFTLAMLLGCRMFIRLEPDVWSIVSRLAGRRATSLLEIVFPRIVKTENPK